MPIMVFASVWALHRVGFPSSAAQLIISPWILRLLSDFQVQLLQRTCCSRRRRLSINRHVREW